MGLGLGLGLRVYRGRGVLLACDPRGVDKVHGGLGSWPEKLREEHAGEDVDDVAELGVEKRARAAHGLFDCRGGAEVARGVESDHLV